MLWQSTSNPHKSLRTSTTCTSATHASARSWSSAMKPSIDLKTTTNQYSIRSYRNCSCKWSDSSWKSRWSTRESRGESTQYLQHVLSWLSWKGLAYRNSKASQQPSSILHSLNSTRSRGTWIPISQNSTTHSHSSNASSQRSPSIRMKPSFSRKATPESNWRIPLPKEHHFSNMLWKPTRLSTSTSTTSIRRIQRRTKTPSHAQPQAFSRSTST